MVTEPNDWRAIKCADIEWRSVPGITSRICTPLYWACKEPKGHDKSPWHTLTLGELADRGARQWVRDLDNCGPVTVESIKLTIDYAAAGYSITRVGDPYVPRPWTKT